MLVYLISCGCPSSACCKQVHKNAWLHTPVTTPQRGDIVGPRFRKPAMVYTSQNLNGERRLLHAVRRHMSAIAPQYEYATRGKQKIEASLQRLATIGRDDLCTRPVHLVATPLVRNSIAAFTISSRSSHAQTVCLHKNGGPVYGSVLNSKLQIPLESPLAIIALQRLLAAPATPPTASSTTVPPPRSPVFYSVMSEIRRKLVIVGDGACGKVSVVSVARAYASSYHPCADHATISSRPVC